ncbi:hypothetical protein DSM3645_26769 [Blastopirellula marina DSM 3645]|uniref:Arylsulfotransferase (ASST) n=1 Tax=Blastopirellula marina DSM 3645 TaxID=314230 RepID=A3ZY18_9BACT|nr:hypothetical protein DSM3645_26769 [Blastopirellula marina DSM 3645]
MLALLSRGANAETTSDPPLKAPRDGVSLHKPTALPGYSLIAPLNSTSTYLVDMDGRVVHQWKSDFTPALSAYLLENGHLLRPAAQRGGGFGGPGAGGRIQEFDWDGELVWDYSFAGSKLRPHHDICPLPNGNVLVVASDPKTAEESLAMGRRAELVTEQLLPDCILEIKPTGPTTGEIVWRWRAWDHLVQDADPLKPGYGDVSEHPELIDVNFSTAMMDRMMQDPAQLAKLRSLGYVGGGTAADKPAGGEAKQRESGRDPQPDDQRPGHDGHGPRGGDWMHVNSVAYNQKLDQIMISVHEFSEVWIIDHSTTTKEAAAHSGGKSGRGGDLLYRWGNPRVYRSGSNVDQRLFAQHCAHWIADGLPGAGDMLVFNNGLGRQDGAYSSVDQIVLPLNRQGLYDKEEYLAYGPTEAKWTFHDPAKSDFYSMMISGAQRLSNGNTFVCSGAQAMLFEVTPDNEVVWVLKVPGGGMGGPGEMRPGQLVPEFLARDLAISDEQQSTILKLQTKVDAKLETLLSDDQRKSLQQPPMLGFAGPGGPRAPGGGPGAPGGRRGFQPPTIGEVIPRFVLAGLDLNEDQTEELQQLQRQVDQQLAAVWTDKQKATLQEMEQRFAGGPANGPLGGFGPPPGMRPRGGDRQGRPDRGGPGGRGGGPGGVFRVYRYGMDYAAFAGKDLAPRKLLTEEMAPASEPSQRGPGQRPSN